MRILIVSQYYYPETFPSTTIAEELALRGHQVDVVTGKPNYGFANPPKEYDHIAHERHEGVDIYRIILHKRGTGILSLLLNYFSFWRNSKRFLKKKKADYDLVFGLNFSPILSIDGAGRYAKKHRLPYAIYVFDLWPESVVATNMCKKGSWLYRRLLSLSKRIYSYGDAFLLSSPVFEDYLKGTIGLSSPCETVYQPVIDTEHKEPLVSPFSDNEQAVVYCGNLGRLQELEDFVHAFALLPSENSCSFYIIGEGNKGPSLKKLVIDLHLEKRVFFLEHLSREASLPYRRFAFANVVTLKDIASPVSDTLPSKLIASLNDARPILAAIGGDGAKTLRASGGAFVVKSDPQEIANAIAKLASLPGEEREAMGEKNRAYYKNVFAKEKVMDDIEGVLLKLVADKRSDSF